MSELGFGFSHNSTVIMVSKLEEALRRHQPGEARRSNLLEGYFVEKMMP